MYALQNGLIVTDELMDKLEEAFPGSRESAEYFKSMPDVSVLLKSDFNELEQELQSLAEAADRVRNGTD